MGHKFEAGSIRVYIKKNQVEDFEALCKDIALIPKGGGDIDYKPGHAFNLYQDGGGDTYFVFPNNAFLVLMSIEGQVDKITFYVRLFPEKSLPCIIGIYKLGDAKADLYPIDEMMCGLNLEISGRSEESIRNMANLFWKIINGEIEPVERKET